MTTDYFAAFRDLIEERCGIHFDDSQRASLSASLTLRMQQLGLSDAGEYYERLRLNGVPGIETEFRALVNLVTVTETSFFRDPSQFRLLRNHILPSLIAELAPTRKRTLRIWSAGCSSGAEAYSIALTLWEAGMYLGYPDWTFEIVGSDLNTEVLEAARRGEYSARAVRNVEGEWLQRYFHVVGPGFSPASQRYCLNDEIKRLVRFEFGNLTQLPMPCPGNELQDVVFCKNVAIYFGPDATRQLVRGLHDRIVDGGYLLLGHSESLWQMSDGFELIERDHAYCYRKARRSSIVDRPSSVAPVSAHRPSPIAHRPSTIDHRPSDTDQYTRCLSVFRAGDWTAAEALLTGLIRSCQTFVPAYLLLGGVYAHSGRYDEAMAEAESALRLNGLEPRAHLLIGMIAARRQQQDEALQSLRRALYLDDSLALAHFYLANLYRDRGDVARACHEYQNVVHSWERHTFDLTEEFASDLTAEQVVQFCSESLQKLGGSALCR